MGLHMFKHLLREMDALKNTTSLDFHGLESQ